MKIKKTSATSEFRSIKKITLSLCCIHTLANLTATPPRINSQCSLSAVSVESSWSFRKGAKQGKSLRMGWEVISSNAKQQKLIFFFTIKQQVNLKKKSLFRRLFKHSTFEENINSCNLAANKKHERCLKN